MMMCFKTPFLNAWGNKKNGRNWKEGATLLDFWGLFFGTEGVDECLFWFGFVLEEEAEFSRCGREGQEKNHQTVDGQNKVKLKKLTKVAGV